MLSGDLCKTSTPQVELDQRARDTRLGLEQIERLVVHAPALCCTDQQPGAVGPRSDILREANVLRPPKLEHAVQRGDSNGHLGRLPPSGP